MGKRMPVSFFGAASLICFLAVCAGAETFQDFMKKDKEAFREFVEGPKPGAEKAKTGTAKVRADPSPERIKAQQLYNRYCELRNTLEDPDPQRGYNKRISDLEARLYPTGRPFADWFQWSTEDNIKNYPLLQELIVRKRAMLAEMDDLARQWADAGFNSCLRPLSDCYCRRAWEFWLDRSVYPPLIRSNEVDYVGFHVERIWPTNDIPCNADGVYEREPPAPPAPPSAPVMDESTNNVPSKKSWDEMTSDERHEYLKAYDPDAWRIVYDALVSGATNLIEQVKTALNATGATAKPPAISFTNLTPTAVTAVKPWNAMTPQERHDALKGNDNAAWDAVRDSLLSGDPKQVEVVIEALGARTPPPCNCPRCKPQGGLDCSECEWCLVMTLTAPPGTGRPAASSLRFGLLSPDAKVVRATVAGILGNKGLAGDALTRFAYANGYMLGRSEKRGRASGSMLETTAGAYERDGDRQAVRAGYADAVAGKAMQPR